MIAISTFEDASTRHADVVLPAEAYAEKEGTVTHPDGRLQRLRPAVPRPGEVRPIWQVLVELSPRSGTRPASTRLPRRLPRSPTRSPSTPGITPRRSAAGASAGRSATRRAASCRRPADRRTSPVPPDDEDVRDVRPGSGSAAGHLPGPLGGRGHGAQRGAAVPRAAPAGRARARRTRERLGVGNGDQVEVRSNGHRGPRAGRAARADATRGGVPDRGHGREQRERAHRRRSRRDRPCQPRRPRSEAEEVAGQ